MNQSGTLEEPKAKYNDVGGLIPQPPGSIANGEVVGYITSKPEYTVVKQYNEKGRELSELEVQKRNFIVKLATKFKTDYTTLSKLISYDLDVLLNNNSSPTESWFTKFKKWWTK